MQRFAVLVTLLAGCSKEAPKSQGAVADPIADPGKPSVGPTRSAKLPDLPKRTGAVEMTKSKLPPEANPPGVPVISGELKVDRDVQYIDEAIGTGAAPVAGKPVSVHYSGWLTDGKGFDSSVERGDPIKFNFGAGQVIKGWDIGLSSMRVGGKRRIIIPAELAYGDRGAGGAIPPGAVLVFDVELVAVGD
jgi:peptidylprolyl isomerase